MRHLKKSVILLSIVIPTQAFALSAASQEPATVNNETLTLDLTTHATGVVGTASVVSMVNAYTYGSATLDGNDLVYKPQGYFTYLYHGQTTDDYVGYCLTDSSSAISCNFVQILVAGTGDAPAYNTYYFSPSGSDTAGAGTSASPWAWVGAHSYVPGDVLYLMDGTYVETDNTANVAINSTGTAAAPIHLACQHALACTIENATHGASAIEIGSGAAYLDIGGLGGLNITTNSNGTSSPSSPDGKGIEIAGTAGATLPIHHISIENNVLSNHGAAAIVAAGNLNPGQALDYLTIQRNVMYNNARWSTLHGSGLSIYEPAALDTAAGYHIRVVANVSYDNNDCDSCGYPTDGNGFILDDFDWEQYNSDNPSNPYPPYTARALVADNIAFNNGGRGIHIFQDTYNSNEPNDDTSSVDVINNTACGNNNDTSIGAASTYEIGSNGGASSASGSIDFDNNLALTTNSTLLNVSTTLASAVAAGAYSLPVTSVTGASGGVTINGNGIPAASPANPYGDIANSIQGNTLEGSQGTQNALPTGSPITLTDPLWAMGEVLSTDNHYSYNLLASPYGYYFWLLYTGGYTFNSSNIEGSSAGFTCPTYTTLQPLATITAAVTPASGSAPLTAGNSAIAFPYDINGKVRSTLTDIGAVEASP